MPAELRIDPPIFDAEQFEMVRRLISTERLRVHLDELDRQGRALSGSADENIQDEVHKIVSQAGMIGLLRLSDRARALEQAYESGVGFAPSLLACRDAVEDIRRYAIPAIGAVCD